MPSTLIDMINATLRDASSVRSTLTKARSLAGGDPETQKWIDDGIAMVVDYARGLQDASLRHDARRVAHFASLFVGLQRYFVDCPPYPMEEQVLPIVKQLHKDAGVVAFDLINDLDPSSVEQANKELQSFVSDDPKFSVI